MISRVLLVLAIFVAGASPAFADGLDALSEANPLAEGIFGSTSAHSAAPNVGVDALTFDVAFDSGPSQLSDSLTLNGTAMSLVFEYDGRDAAATWPSGSAGPTLTRSGGSTTLGAAPFTETASRGAIVSASTVRYTHASDFTTANIGATEDFVIELVQCTNPAGGGGYAVAKNTADGLAGTGGWWLGLTTIADFAFGDGTTTRSYSGVITVGACYHYLVFGDHSDATIANSLVAHVNGAASAQSFTGALSTVGAINGSASLSLLNLNAGPYGYVGGSGLVSARMWKCTACMAGGATNPTQWAAVSKERFSKLTGVYPRIARGTATPSIMTRASIATLDIDRDGDGVRRLFTVGSGWPRVARRREIVGGEYLSGALIETQITNLKTQSQTFDNVAWDKGNATVTANAIASPDGTTSADALIGAATATVKFARQAATTTAVPFVDSVFAKAGAGVGNKALVVFVEGAHGACFRLDTCAVIGNFDGTTPTATRGESYGDGWCRLSVSWTAAATSPFVRYYASDDVATCTSAAIAYTGDAVTPDVYLWGAQLEAAGNHAAMPTSYVATVAASSTRVEDFLSYATGLNVDDSRGTWSMKTICPTSTTNANVRAGSITNAGTSNITLLVDSGSSSPATSYVLAGAAQATAFSAGTLIDGELHDVRGSWATNDVRTYYDLVAGATDTVATMMTDGTTTEIRIGRNGAAASSGSVSPCIYGRTRIWNKAQTVTP